MKTQQEFKFNFRVVEDYIKSNNITIAEFCKRAHIGKSTYYTFKRGSLNFDSMVALRLVKILGFKFDQLVVRA